MSSREIHQDILDRTPIFTIDRSILLSEEPPISSIIWIGVDGFGELDNLLPILFLPNDNVGELENIVKQSDWGQVSAPTYHDSPEIEQVEINLTYDIRPVSLESQIDSGESDIPPTHDNIRDLAQRWKTEYSENSVDTELLGDGNPVFNYFCTLPVLSNHFNTVIPFFTEVPSEEVIKRNITDLYIPCISVVGNRTESGIQDHREIETTFTTSIIELL